ncbi:FAD-dependent oxidoreductase [Novosphingobium profundi]|uniref:FAD-dependent oxidoreductase n=1 Tax=Novosphingobium profundi TaxID=1774954 RepID=UPI001FEBB7EE|nr:FAD-dependent oxidoreductase [Novosphingobium profundi]
MATRTRVADLRTSPQVPQGNVIVLGGGIAGLSAAQTLTAAGMQVTLVEAEASCGGTHRSHAIGPYTFDVGSIFYEANARLFALAPGLKEMCPTISRQQRRIAPGGELLHYPLEPREFLRRRPLELLLALLDLAWSRLRVRRNGGLDAISRKRLGRRFFESTGLRHYITRFHHVPPEEVSETFFFHRMGFIDKATRLRALARLTLRALFSRGSVANRPRPVLHVRPREGFAPLFERILAQLRAQGVETRLATRIDSIRREGSSFVLETDSGTLRASAIVSTIPLATLHKAVFGTSCGLEALDMTTLFASASWLDARVGNVLFNFDRHGRWKRATIYSRIYPEPALPREFLAIECTIPPGGEHAPDVIFADFRGHVEGLGLARDLALEGHTRVEGCYPLYRPDTEATLRNTLERIAQAGIVTVGRQGRFEYLPTSSGVIRRVREELEKAGLKSPADGPPASGVRA